MLVLYAEMRKQYVDRSKSGIVEVDFGQPVDIHCQNQVWCLQFGIVQSNTTNGCEMFNESAALS